MSGHEEALRYLRQSLQLERTPRLRPWPSVSLIRNLSSGESTWTLPAIREIPCPSRNRAAASFSLPHTSATPPHQSLCAGKRHPEQMRMCIRWLHDWVTTKWETAYLEMATNLKIPCNTKLPYQTSWVEEHHFSKMYLETTGWGALPPWGLPVKGPNPSTSLKHS